VLYSSFSRSMAVVIVVFVCGVGLGFWGLVLEPVQERVHPISQRGIVTGRSINMMALLRMRIFLGRFKVMPVWSLAESGDKCF
jgi:hypothetical protein